MESVSFYESDSESDSVDVPLPRKRPRKHQWVHDQRFQCKTDATKFVSSETTWSIRYTIDAADGRKVFYHCNMRSLHLPCIHEAIQVQAFHWDGNSSQTGQAAAGSQTDSNWSKTQKRKTKESHKSFTCRLIIFFILFYLTWLCNFHDLCLI